MNTISFWQRRLGEIYLNPERTPDYMMAHVYTAASDLGRVLLRQEGDNRRDEAVISAVSWMMALASHFQIDYEQALVSRFPGRCRYCLLRPCGCDVTGKRAKNHHGSFLSAEEIDQEMRALVNSIRNTNTQINFDWFVKQLSAIYPSNRALLLKGGHGYVTGKMLEEGGELHRAYSDNLRGGEGTDKIAGELADLTAWIVSCWDLDNRGRRLDAEWAELYAGGCPTCRKMPCECRDYSITRGQEGAIREIGEQLRALAAKGLETQPLREALRDAEQAELTPTPKLKRSLLQRAKKVLPLLEGYNESSQAFGSIGQHLKDAMDALETWL